MARIRDLNKLLNSREVNNSIIELDNFIGEVCEYGDGMDRLTEPQKLFYLNQNLEREVNNGGFGQYFFNSSGDFAHETVQGLKVIGAVRTAHILQAAIDQFPQAEVPGDTNKRRKILRQIETFANAAWEGLDQEFLRYQDDLNTLNIEYVRKNTESF